MLLLTGRCIFILFLNTFVRLILLFGGLSGCRGSFGTISANFTALGALLLSSFFGSRTSYLLLLFGALKNMLLFLNTMVDQRIDLFNHTS